MAVCASCGHIQNHGAFCMACGKSFSSTTMPLLAPASPMEAHASAMLGRIAITTCPRCGAGMAIVRKRSKLGLGLIIFGILTIWLVGLGVIFIICGIVLNIIKLRKLAYQCPNCNYSTA